MSDHVIEDTNPDLIWGWKAVAAELHVSERYARELVLERQLVAARRADDQAVGVPRRELLALAKDLGTLPEAALEAPREPEEAPPSAEVSVVPTSTAGGPIMATTCGSGSQVPIAPPGPQPDGELEARIFAHFEAGKSCVGVVITERLDHVTVEKIHDAYLALKARETPPTPPAMVTDLVRLEKRIARLEACLDGTQMLLDQVIRGVIQPFAPA